MNIYFQKNTKLVKENKWRCAVDLIYEQMIEEYYAEFFPMLYAQAKTLLKDSSRAEEAVQDVFRLACKKPQQLYESENPVGWLVVTLKYVIKNINKSFIRYDNLIQALKIVTSNSYNSCPDSFSEDVDFKLDCIKIVGEESYNLIKMVIIDRMTIMDAAKNLGISTEACKKRLYRAKKKLSNNLNKNYF